MARIDFDASTVCPMQDFDDEDNYLQPPQPQGQWSSAGQPPISAPAAPKAVGLAWPPGVAGELAQFIYASSYSPVQEVAIAAALCFLAAVCGRAYRTHTEMDLALYLILVAHSGIGKDAIHQGIPKLIRLSEVPEASDFVLQTNFASGVALHKAILDNPGFLYLQGEFGRQLKRMSNPQDTPMQDLRTMMTNSYGKQFLEGKSYSNEENSKSGVEWPALSFLGETTPGTFLESLTSDMMADGFLSRFITITYEGEKPPPNHRARFAIPAPELLEKLKALVQQAAKHRFTNSPIFVNPEESIDLIVGFEEQCREQLNATKDEYERQVWNRAALKYLKVICLLAVADNPFEPRIHDRHEVWAKVLVLRDIDTFLAHKRNGDIGISDDARERKLVAFMRDYLVTAPSASYKIPPAMHQAAIIPRSYLQRRAASLPAFANHRLGSTKALDDALRSLDANGIIKEVDKARLIEDFNFFGKAYRIVRLPE